MDCIFCKIINKEMPCSKVYEDDEVLAFLDINPVNKGHTLVIPKEHNEDLLELREDLAEHMIRVVKRLAPAILQATGSEAFNMILNNGKNAGQIIDHVHFHIIPRHEDDGLIHWRSIKYQDDAEKEEFRSKIEEEASYKD